MLRPRTVNVCLALLLATALSLPASAEITGSVIEKAAGEDLRATIESIGGSSRGEPVWIAYEVAMDDPQYQVCCHSHESKWADAECSLDGTRSWSMGHREESDQAWSGGSDLMIFYRYQSGLDEVRLYTSDCVVKAEGSTVYWLGRPDSAESVRVLSDLVEGRWTGAREKVRREAIAAVALHAGPSPVLRLDGWAREGLSGELREAAVFWLGSVGGDRGFETVRDLAWNDDDRDIRDKAVFAISISRSGESAQELARLAREHRDSDTREKAVFWLGQKKTPEVVTILSGIVESDPNEDVREKAVFALSQVRSDEAVDVLISLARTHQSSEIRKKSIFWLGQIAGRKISTFLEETVDSDLDDEIREYAVFAISQRPREESVPVLSRLATTHQSLRVRKKALFWLSQIDDEGAIDTIEKILEE